MMKSLGAAVRISKGSPPASRTASFTTLAMPSRWLKQMASSDELLTTAIFGLRRSASVSPSAFHCARRTASRGEPGSKLLLSAFIRQSYKLCAVSTPSLARPAAVTHTGEGVLGQPLYWSWVLVALTICYIVNVMDRSQILAASLQAIKKEFGATDFQLGMLSGIPFALFYSFLGIPIAALADRWNRVNVLALAVAMWSGMTALCGMAVNFPMLFAARVGTAIGEAGGSPPSHSLISDYFPKTWRGTAFSVYALAVPIGTALGAFMGGWGNQNLGWRNTFIVVGLPGLFLALAVRLTVKEPPRGMADGLSAARAAATRTPGLVEVLSYLWARKSFRHLSLAAALHSV